MLLAGDASTPALIVSGVTGSAAFLTLAYNAWRNRNVDKRDEDKQIIDAMNVLIEAERKTTDRQVGYLNEKISDLDKQLANVRVQQQACEERERLCQQDRERLQLLLEGRG